MSASRSKTAATLSLVFVALATHTACAGTATTLASVLEVAQLRPERAPVPATKERAFALTVAPVQLGTFADLEHEGRAEEPFFAGHTMPLVPYAGFWLTVGNQSDTPMELDPGQLSLHARHAIYKLLDSGSIAGRSSTMITTLARGHRSEGVDVVAKQRELPFLDQKVTIPPHAAWQGFVVFDVHAYTADEYNAFLSEAGAVKLVYSANHGAPVEVSFNAESRKVAAVCVAGTKQPTLRACDIVPSPATPN